MVDDVEESVAFYTKFLGFEVLNKFPAFADVARGKLRLLLSGPASSAGRPMPDGAKPGPGWNRIHLIVDPRQGRFTEDSSPLCDVARFRTTSNAPTHR
jgi:catechol 2,3-dioxygenase-like lactoylglutathione lyase family enzyme